MKLVACQLLVSQLRWFWGVCGQTQVVCNAYGPIVIGLAWGMAKDTRKYVEVMMSYAMEYICKHLTNVYKPWDHIAVADPEGGPWGPPFRPAS